MIFANLFCAIFSGIFLGMALNRVDHASAILWTVILGVNLSAVVMRILYDKQSK